MLARADEERPQIKALLKLLAPIHGTGRKHFRVYKDGWWQSFDRDEIANWITKFCDVSEDLSNYRINQLVGHLAAETHRKPEEFNSFAKFDDAGWPMLCLKNGILQINASVRTKEQEAFSLGEHRPEEYFAAQIPISYKPPEGFDPWKPGPKTLEFLNSALGTEADQKILQMQLGYLFYPDHHLQTAFVMGGPGGTGKSTICKIPRSILGPTLCTAAPLESIADQQRPYSLIRLEHAALNIVGELKPTEYKSEKLKQIISGEPVEIRAPFELPYDGVIQPKIWCMTNHETRFSFSTDAELRRFQWIAVIHKPDEDNKKLGRQIEAEVDTNLLWGLEGLLLVIDGQPFPEPSEQSSVMRRDFALVNASEKIFLEECFEYDPRAWENSNHVWEAFCTFCEKNELAIPEPKTKPWMLRRLRSLNPEKISSKLEGPETDRFRVLRGIKFKKDCPHV